MSPENQTFADGLTSLGQNIGNPITVRLSNEIVTLLSSQLYQSPLKAIEELVVNSYDADARECRLFVSQQGSDLQTIMVYDDGIGMDADGLSDLWLIARSKKRDENYQASMDRKQIGKFGIGKLATYAIANNITYISRTEDQILAVTANFDQFKEDPHGTVPLKLPVKKIDNWNLLSESEVFHHSCEFAGIDVETLFDTAHKTWTVALLEELKPIRIHHGRLRWVLSTAMPLRTDFKLFLNKEEIFSSKEDIGVVVEFNVEELPQKRLDSINSKFGVEWRVEKNGLVSELFHEGISGSVTVTEQSLHAGKSSDLGRSHGFFVKVRDRLVNEEDPLFGLSPLSYQTFNRFRADVNADDLDKIVTAQREGVGESPLKVELIPLLAELFYEARDRYDDYLKEQDAKEKRKKETERTYVPTRLVEYPIADVLSVPSIDATQGAEADESWFYLEVGAEEDIRSLAHTLYKQPRSEKYRYRYTNAGKTGRLVRFDPEQSTFYLNQDHDLVVAYYDDPRARVLLEDIATAEAVLEVYLREHGMPAHVVGDVLERRDSLLRGLANEHMFSIATISQFLRDSEDDEHSLEVALVAASRALGFVATHISGAGEPDGIGRFRNYPSGEKKITLEAKSSKGTPELSQLDFAGLAEHVGNSDADGCLLVAPSYPGSKSSKNTAASRRAKENKISCWSVDQLARVVSAVETRHIGAKEVLDIVLSKFAPSDVSDEVEKLLSDPAWEYRALYVEIIGALRRLEGRLEDTARTVSHVAVEVSTKEEFAKVSENDIKDALTNLSAASQGSLLLRDDRIIITNASIDEIEIRVSSLTRNGGTPRSTGAFREHPSETI